MVYLFEKPDYILNRNIIIGGNKMNRILKIINVKEELITKGKEAIRNAPSMRNYGNSPLLCKVGDLIYSYNTCVAAFASYYDEEESRQAIIVPKYHSTTTSRHINRIASQYNTEVIKLY